VDSGEDRGSIPLASKPLILMDLQLELANCGNGSGNMSDDVLALGDFAAPAPRANFRAPSVSSLLEKKKCAARVEILTSKKHSYRSVKGS
jgi:hypothetical protein